MADSKKYGRTSNLFDYQTMAAGTTGFYINSSGDLMSSASWAVTDYIPVSGNQFVLSKVGSTTAAICFYNDNKQFLYGQAYGTQSTGDKQSIYITIPDNITNVAYARFSYVQSGQYIDTLTNLMLNSGSTALPYQPYLDWLHSLRKLTTATDTLTTLPADLYADGNSATVGLVGNMQQAGTPTPQNPIQPQECGDLETTGEHAGQYKIPILSANTTTPVYLSEVQSTRQIKKYEFTGQEEWKSPLSDNTRFYLDTITPDYLRANSQITYMCTHYKPYEQTTSASLVPNLSMSMSSGTAQRLYISDNNFTTTDQFKTYLQQQYSAGTPVCVWYILATSTTGIVNEPLRKIGNYADSVIATNIPTTAGGIEFDVLTTLKPSEVSLSYTGWHDASVGEWDGSQWQ